MKVEIWSDVVCPWCYIGKRRFEKALEEFEHKGEVEIIYRSFELDPNAPAKIEGSLDEMLASKYGRSLEEARQMNAQVTEAAAGEGLEYRLDQAQHGNTFNAHRLLQFAKSQGRQPELKESLMRGYFTEGMPLHDVDVLVEKAVQAGLDEARSRSVLEGDEFTSEVQTDQQTAREIGASGVPFFVFGQKYAVSGAQPQELFLEVLEKTWEETQPVAAAGAAGGSAGTD